MEKLLSPGSRVTPSSEGTGRFPANPLRDVQKPLQSLRLAPCPDLLARDTTPKNSPRPRGIGTLLVPIAFSGPSPPYCITFSKSIVTGSPIAI